MMSTKPTPPPMSTGVVKYGHGSNTYPTRTNNTYPTHTGGVWRNGHYLSDDDIYSLSDDPHGDIADWWKSKNAQYPDSIAVTVIDNRAAKPVDKGPSEDTILMIDIVDRLDVSLTEGMLTGEEGAELALALLSGDLTPREIADKLTDKALDFSALADSATVAVEA